MKTHDLVERCLLALREDEYPLLREECRQWMSANSEQPEPRIVITVEGGVVQSILSSVPADVLTIDYDVDGRDSRRLVEVPQEGLGERRTELAHVMIDSAGNGLNEPARVNELFTLLDAP